MFNDPVVIGTMTCTILALIGAFVYGYSVWSRLNGSWEDGYICALLLAFASWAGYLGWARSMMYTDKETWLYLMQRTQYIPPIFFMVVALGVLIAHKISSVRRRCREEKRRKIL